MSNKLQSSTYNLVLWYLRNRIVKWAQVHGTVKIMCRKQRQTLIQRLLKVQYYIPRILTQILAYIMLRFDNGVNLYRINYILYGRSSWEKIKENTLESEKTDLVLNGKKTRSKSVLQNIVANLNKTRSNICSNTVIFKFVEHQTRLSSKKYYYNKIVIARHIYLTKPTCYYYARTQMVPERWSETRNLKVMNIAHT